MTIDYFVYFSATIYNLSFHIEYSTTSIDIQHYFERKIFQTNFMNSSYHKLAHFSEL